MKVWVVRDLEPIPTDPDDRRLMRTSMLCTAFAEAGHDVTWFTSSFDHYLKRQRATSDTRIAISPRFHIEVLACHGYRRNVGLARILHNRQFARRFQQRFRLSGEKPDLLLTDIPTTETAEMVVALGKAANIPTVLSVRDTWPDSFVDLMPRPVRPVAKLLNRYFDRQATSALGQATALVGISDRYLTWGQLKGRRQATGRDCVVPLGYVPIELTADARQAHLDRMGIDGTAFNVVFSGSWGHTADLDLVARSAAILRHRSEIRFVVLGQPVGEVGARLGQLPNVLLPGWRSREEIAAVLGVASIGLMPYRSDAPQGVPNKAFEYMAYGAHQISTLGGELEAFYAATGAGECLSADATVLAGAIDAHFGGSRSRLPRQQLQQIFHDRFRAETIYAEMARNVTALVD